MTSPGPREEEGEEPGPREGEGEDLVVMVGASYPAPNILALWR